MDSKEHRLTAILFSDVVGYSAIMSRDENEAWEILQKAKGLHLKLAEKYKGELLKELGDGFLLCFPSVINAVHCARHLIQEVKDDPSLSFHIGLHMGDVIVKEGDVFGDGVNIAARLEQEAIDNEVIISESVYQNIKNQPDIEAELVGKIQLKNIEGLVTVYKLKDGRGHSNLKQKNKKGIILSIIILVLLPLIFIAYKYLDEDTLVMEPTIAVLPFENLSDDPNQEYFSVGVSDEIRSKLSFIHGLTVRGRSSSMYFKNNPESSAEIARLLNVNYLLEGSVRSYDKRTYFNLSLIDVHKNAVVLPIQIEKTLDDIFEVQSDIAKMVASELKPILMPEDKKKIEKIPTEDLDAYRYYLLARYDFLQGQSRDDIDGILENLEKAISIDSSFAKAYALKAGVLLSLTGWGYQNVESTINVAKSLVEKAIEIDPELSEAHQSMAGMYSYDWNIKGAYEELLEAIRLDPGNDLNYLTLWQLMMNVGEYDLALQAIIKARKLNPFNAINDAQVGLTYFNMGEMDSAIIELKQNLERFPDNDHAKFVLGGCYQAIGEYDKAVDYYLDRSPETKYVNWALGHAYGRMGKKDSARKVLNYLIDKYNTNYVPPSQIALVYFGLRNEDSTYYWMEKAHLEKDWTIIKLVPLFDSLLVKPPYNEWFGGKELREMDLGL